MAGVAEHVILGQCCRDAERPEGISGGHSPAGYSRLAGRRMQAGQPVRPMALVPNLQEVMDAATRAAVAAQGSQSMIPGFNQQPRSAFNPVAPPPLYPEIALFSQLGQLFPQAAELAQAQQQQQAADSGSRGRARSSDKASSAYASRHQAAEQRRRTRINDRCAVLMAKPRGSPVLFTESIPVPIFTWLAQARSAPRCCATCRAGEYGGLFGGIVQRPAPAPMPAAFGTSFSARHAVSLARVEGVLCFAQEVIKYVQSLQQRVRELEAAASGSSQPRQAMGHAEKVPASVTPFSEVLLKAVVPAASGSPLLGPLGALVTEPAEAEHQLVVSQARDPTEQPASTTAGPEVKAGDGSLDNSNGFRPFFSGQQPGTPTQQPVSGSGTPGARPSPTSSTATEDSSRPPKKRSRAASSAEVPAGGVA